MYLVKVYFRGEEIIRLVQDSSMEHKLFLRSMSWFTDKHIDDITPEELAEAKSYRRELDLENPRVKDLLQLKLPQDSDYDELWLSGKWKEE